MLIKVLDPATSPPPSAMTACCRIVQCVLQNTLQNTLSTISILLQITNVSGFAVRDTVGAIGVLIASGVDDSTIKRPACLCSGSF
jgi:hypothetical protein